MPSPDPQRRLQQKQNRQRKRKQAQDTALLPAGRKLKPLLNFLHVGKTGGTAIKAALKEHTAEGRYRIKLRSHAVRLEHIPSGEKLMFVLRDPLSRFVSGFNSRLRRGRPRYNGEWTKLEERVFKVFSTPDALGLALADPEHPRHKLARNALKHMQHVDHYADWFGTLEQFKTRLNDVIYIGFQDRLEEDFQNMQVLLKLKTPLELPEDPIESHRAPEDQSTELSPKSVEALSAWYKDDIAFVDFCRAWMDERIQAHRAAVEA